MGKIPIFSEGSFRWDQTASLPAITHPSGSKDLLPKLNSPALGSVLLQGCVLCFVFVQTAGWRRLRESQRAEASPGYVSAASELEHVVCLMLQQSMSPGKISLIQLHLERHIFPGVTSSLFQAEVDPVTVGVDPCRVWLC